VLRSGGQAGLPAEVERLLLEVVADGFVVTILEKKIDELRTFEREYRTHWMACLQTQLRDLDGHRSATPTDPMRTPKDLVTSGSGARAETRS
jgi:hypothetical protein